MEEIRFCREYSVQKNNEIISMQAAKLNFWPVFGLKSPEADCSVNPRVALSVYPRVTPEVVYTLEYTEPSTSVNLENLNLQLHTSILAPY